MDWFEDLIEIILALAIAGVFSSFIYIAIADTNVAKIPGATIVLPLVGLAFIFGLVYKAFTMFFKKT
jgi:prepilin-type N-terminal cleavage/methylation domain-containing protein